MEKRSTQRLLAAILSKAQSIYVSGCVSEIKCLPEIITNLGATGATVTGIFNPIANEQTYASAERGIRLRTFFLNRTFRQDLVSGLADFLPWRYETIQQWMSTPGLFDVAIAMLSPPDENGMCSFGLQTDFLPEFFPQVGKVVGFINPHMPQTVGARRIAYRDLALAVDYDVPLLTVVRVKPDKAAAHIAENIANLIDDGATLQLGMGQIPQLVATNLKNHRRIAIHTGLTDDSILTLAECGALDPARLLVSGVAIGSSELYDFIRRSDQMRFESVTFTHAAKNLRGIENFVSINSVLQVDLRGQATAEYIGGRLIAGPGGLPEFNRAALLSLNGKSILAVRAQGALGKSPGIVPVLDPPHVMTVPASDVDYIVTEFGVAHLRYKSFDERAQALIEIADPHQREALEVAYRSLLKMG